MLVLLLRAVLVLKGGHPSLWAIALITIGAAAKVVTPRLWAHFPITISGAVRLLSLLLLVLLVLTPLPWAGFFHHPLLVLPRHLPARVPAPARARTRTHA